MEGVTVKAESDPAPIEFRIEKVSGVFKRRVTKYRELQQLCQRMGEGGWDLVAVTYDWFVGAYVIFFRRRRGSPVG
jgi:hypothetical protein